MACVLVSLMPQGLTNGKDKYDHWFIQSGRLRTTYT